MEEQGGFVGWLIGIGGVIVSTLAGIVTMFYREQVAGYKAKEAKYEAKINELEKRADICETDRNELRVAHAVLTQKYSTLELRVTDLESSKANRDSINRKIDELKE